MHYYTTEKKDEVTMIKFGELSISLASFLTLLSGFIVAVLIMFASKKTFVLGLTTFLVFCVVAYNVNCVQLGHCNTYAWILTILYMGYAAIFALLFFRNKSAFNKKLNSMKKSKY